MNRGRLLLCFGGNGNLNVGTFFEPYLIAIFIDQRILNTEVSIVGPFHNNLCLSGWFGSRIGMILSTVPGKVALA
jgi:hypothetical protein